LIAPETEEAATKRKLVFDRLGDILAQRPKLRLEFDEAVSSVKDITATLLSHGVSDLTVEVTALDGVSDKWVGAGVSCFFRLYEQPPHEGAHLFTFTSRIVSVHRQANGVVQFRLALPEAIYQAQRRHSVRVDVDQRKVPSLKVWRELPSGTAMAAKPPLLDTEADAKSGFKVRNISATGLGLDLSEVLLRKALPRQNKGERFSLHFMALGSPGSPAASFLVNATLCNVIDRPQQSEISLGFEFVAEGVLNEAKRIVWHPLKLDEVSGLGKFIFKWNLDNSREKPSHES